MEKYPLSPPVDKGKSNVAFSGRYTDSGDNTNPSPTPIL
jgi:hypothetical protein